MLIDFPSKSKGDAHFPLTAFDYSGADRDGIRDLIEMFRGRISLNLVFLLLLPKFCNRPSKEL